MLASTLTAPAATPPAAPPGPRQDEGAGAGSKGDKPSAPGDGAPPDDGTNRYAALDKINPAHRKAYLSYVYAEAKGARGEARRLEDRSAWEWLRDNGIDAADDSELAGYPLPEFSTWARYLRNARKATGERKYTSRTAKAPGGSIVSGDGRAPETPDDERDEPDDE